VEKYGTDRQATDDDIMLRLRFVCIVPKATNTGSEYVILLLFPTTTVTQRHLNFALYLHYL